MGGGNNHNCGYQQDVPARGPCVQPHTLAVHRLAKVTELISPYLNEDYTTLARDLFDQAEAEVNQRLDDLGAD